MSDEQQLDENTFYTKVMVIFNNGDVFEGDEINVALVSGFTAHFRGGVKETLFLEGIPRFAFNDV